MQRSDPARRADRLRWLHWLGGTGLAESGARRLCETRRPTAYAAVLAFWCGLRFTGLLMVLRAL